MEVTISLGKHEIPKTQREYKGKSTIAFPDSYCVIDIETTGLSPNWDSIIEIGAIKYADGKEVGRYQTLVQPDIVYDDGTYIDEFITELTGITNEMLANAPKASEVIGAFADFLGNDMIVGYNVNFDINFLYDCFMKNLNCPLSNDFIDAMRMARKLYPEMAHHRLRDMTELYGIANESAHRALSDIEATSACFNLLHQEALEQFEDEESFIAAFHYSYKGKSSNVKARDIQGDESKANVNSPLYGRRCVFTGALEKFVRKEAMQIVADLGGINEDGVTKKTNFLILGNNDYCTTIKDGKSSKQKKAEKYKLAGQDIEIIPETVFYDMLGEE